MIRGNFHIFFARHTLENILLHMQDRPKWFGKRCITDCFFVDESQLQC